MQKKWTARLMALGCSMLLMLLPLAGCDDNSGDENKPGGTGGVSGESVKTALKYDANEELDLGGKTLRISVWGGVTEEGTDEFFDRRYELERRTEERYNVNIEWVPTNASTFVKDVMLAYTSGNTFADLIFAPSSYAFDLCKAGVVLALDDYIDYSTDFYKLTGEHLRYVDSKHYSYMPDDLSVNNVGLFITYNQAILEKAGCEDPMELYKAGKWDWDAFKEIIKKTTIVENGETVQYGIGGTNLLDALCLSDGFSMISMKDNKFQCNLYTDAGLNVLNMLRDIGYTMKAQDGHYGSSNSALTFAGSKTAMMICANYDTTSFITSGMPIATVPLPKGPDADSNVVGLDLQEWWMVSANSEFDTRDLIQVALDMNDNDPNYEDTYFSEETRKENLLTRLYENNVFLTEEEGEFFYDYIMSDDVETILNITCSDIQQTIVTNIYQPIVSGEDPRPVLEKQKPVIETALKNMLPESMR